MWVSFFFKFWMIKLTNNSWHCTVEQRKSFSILMIRLVLLYGFYHAGIFFYNTSKKREQRSSILGMCAIKVDAIRIKCPFELLYFMVDTDAGVYKCIYKGEHCSCVATTKGIQSILGLSYHLVSSAQRAVLVLNKCVFWPLGNIITHRHSISSLFTHKTVCELKAATSTRRATSH